jgi:triosephosphate isomerase
MAVRDALEGSAIQVGAQNMHWEESGAFTGAVSPLMLVDLVDLVILGHSERRTIFGETDEMVNKKVLSALDHGLKPIVCVGENLEENEAGKTEAVVGWQVRAAFEGVTAEQARTMVVAYEPIWAIGTGVPAHGPDAARIIGEVVRGSLAELYDDGVAQAIRIQYGGSVKPKNAEEFLGEVEIDGALVGGASLKAEDFAAIIRVGVDTRDTS